MTECPSNDSRCGEVKAVQGRMPNGWIQVRVATAPHSRWYCSATCLVLAHGGRVAQDGPTPDESMWAPDSTPVPLANLFAVLTQVTGQPISMMTATPARLRRSIDVAFDRLREWVDYQAALDGRNRPTTASLLAEMSKQPTMGCTKCGLAKPLSAFSPSTVERGSGWCQACEAERQRAG